MQLRDKCSKIHFRTLVAAFPQDLGRLQCILDASLKYQPSPDTVVVFILNLCIASSHKVDAFRKALE